VPHWLTPPMERSLCVTDRVTIKHQSHRPVHSNVPARARARWLWALKTIKVFSCPVSWSKENRHELE
jgi:hypothetical protein